MLARVRGHVDHVMHDPLVTQPASNEMRRLRRFEHLYY